MNIDFSPQHEAFRGEVRRFLDTALTDELRQAARFRAGVFQEYEHNIRWHRILFKQGWIAPAWPKEHGGPGWDLVQRYLWSSECAQQDVPCRADGFGNVRTDLDRPRHSGAKSVVSATHSFR